MFGQLIKSFRAQSLFEIARHNVPVRPCTHPRVNGLGMTILAKAVGQF